MAEAPETLFGLRGRPWKPDYGPADDPLTSFYIPALERSVRYDRNRRLLLVCGAIGGRAGHSEHDR